MLDWRPFLARRVGSYLLGLTVALGCQKVDHPPAAAVDDDGEAEPNPHEGAAGDAGISLPVPTGDPAVPAPDGAASCGGQTIQAVVDRPNLYFVIDISGSMGDPITPSGSTKYVAARRAIGGVLRAIGHRVRYGAMIFPATKGDHSCDGGREILPMSDGDPLGGRAPSDNGPTLQLLLNRLASRGPGGATPTASGLAAAREVLTNQGGRNHVVLATDGAPNCGEEAHCGTDRCIPDIEKMRLSAESPQICGVDLNCCAAGVVNAPGRTLCMDDRAAIAEVAALAGASIPTYVIGMPGSEAYGNVLSRLAKAGGTERTAELPFYAVTDERELTDALLEIGAGLTIGCEIALDSVPADSELVNVYFDRELVPQSAEDGWEWTAETEVTLRGAACQTLQSGDVSDVDVVYGCRTVVR